MRHVANPYRLYLVMRGINAFALALVLTYELAYHTVVVGLTPIQLVLVGVVLESMTILFEIPTGMFADLFSRRLSVILGILLSGGGFLLEALIPSFTVVLLAQVLWGIGFTFYSGAEAAWIVDEIGTERAHTAFLRATQISQVLTIAGTFCGALLSSVSIPLPVMLGASVFLVLGASLCFTMPETGFQPTMRNSQQHVWAHLLQPLRDNIHLVRTHPILWMILLLGVIIGLYVGGFDRLYTPHLLTNITFPSSGSLTPVVWLGVINGLVSIGSLIGTEVVRRWYRTTDQLIIMRLLVGLYSGMLAGSLVFALTGVFILAVAGFCLTQTLRNVSRPLLLLWINHNAAKHIRATVISTYWQANAFGQIAGSPVLGWLGTTASLHLALGVGTAIYAATLPLVLLAQRRWNHVQQRRPVTAEAEQKDNDTLYNG